MKRRADLIFRSKSLEKSIPIENFKWSCLDKAYDSQNCKEDFYIVGTIIKIFEKVIVESDGWNWKEDSKAYRQGLVLKDLSKDKSKNGRDHFRVMMYGTYACDFELLNAKPGDILTIVNPMIKPTWKFPYNDENQNHLHDFQVYVGPNLSSKVCVHSDMPVIQIEKNKSIDDLLVHRIELNTISPSPKVKRTLVKPEKKKPKTEYNLLKDCKAFTSKQYNTWGLVTRISRFPAATRGTKIMAQVYIEDADSAGTYGKSDYQFSILSDKVEEYPPIVLHSILRIHHMKVENYQGNPTFRVFDARAVTVFLGKDGDPIEPSSTKPTNQIEFSDDDKNRVQNLRLWWKQESKRRHAVDSQGFSQELTQDISTIKGAETFNLTCKVLNIADDQSAILVTDGKKSPMPLETLDHLYKVDQSEVAIFVKNCESNPGQKLTLPNIGDFVHLANVECISVDGEKRKFQCTFFADQVRILNPMFASVKEIIQRLANQLPTVEDVISDDTLHELLNPINTQTQTQGVKTENDHIVAVYPSNMDALLIESNPESSENTAVIPSQSVPGNTNPVISQDLTKLTQSSDGLSQVFFTCPEDDGNSSRLSPSPERAKYSVTTNTNFPWTTIEELKQMQDQDTNSFRVQGYISTLKFSRPNWKQCVVMVCPFCCNVIKFDAKKFFCQDCKNNRILAYHFKLIFEEYSPQGIIPSMSPKLELFLAGYHAEVLVQISVKEFLDNTDKRREVFEKLEGLVDEPVLISLSRACEPDKNYGYQIINSFIVR